MGDSVEIGVIGGTGVYDPGMLEGRREVRVHTPYGATSDLVTLGSIGGRRVAFLPRHGRGHTIPPHNIPVRANIWALKALGVRQVVASCAVGSLREDYRPGDFVITDQFVDRTLGRPDTFYEGGQVCHISGAEPICPTLSSHLLGYARKLGLMVHPKGTYICVNGPRFSTRAESRLYRSWGCDTIGMTLYPECVLAREAEMCYASVAMVTDYDSWSEPAVTAAEVIKVMRRNSENFKKLVMGALPGVPPPDVSCCCGSALKSALV